MKNNLNEQTITNFEKLVQLVKILRSEDGCDWDKVQTRESLIPYFIEEVYELVDSIDRKDYKNTKEELGDVMLHLVFQAQISNERGAYTINITSHESNVTIVATGTEVELALKVQKRLKEYDIHSKVVSMPCMELFDKQPEDYRKEIIEHDSLIVTLEAGSKGSWQKYIKNKGLNIGVDQFGESAPYKDIYSHFELTEDKIVGFIQKKLRE